MINKIYYCPDFVDILAICVSYIEPMLSSKFSLCRYIELFLSLNEPSQGSWPFWLEFSVQEHQPVPVKEACMYKDGENIPICLQGEQVKKIGCRLCRLQDDREKFDKWKAGSLFSQHLHLVLFPYVYCCDRVWHQMTLETHRLEVVCLIWSIRLIQTVFILWLACLRYKCYATWLVVSCMIIIMVFIRN